MLDQDLAEIYGVETKVLNQTVKRNRSRFPDEFMFQLTLKEARNLTSQSVTSNKTASLCASTDLRSQIVTSRFGGRRYKPFAFTEHGAVMLASVLRSKQAVQMSIEVVKSFVQLRRAMSSHQDMAKEISEIRNFMLKQSNKTDREFKRVWTAIDELARTDENGTSKSIGFRVDE